MAIAPEDALGLDEAAQALDNGWTLPARWYSDPQVAELEYQRIFAHSWTLLCPESKLASTGDHVVGNSGRVPVVVTRDADGAAARLRQRLPAPRPPGGAAGRLPQAPAVPLPRLDLHARRQAPECAAHVARDGLRPRRSLARPGRRSTSGGASSSSIPTSPRRACSTSTLRSSRSRPSAASASPTGSSASTGSTPWRRTGRSSSRTASSATTARRCTRRASATPSSPTRTSTSSSRRAACCASSRPTTRAARTRAGAARAAMASASSTCGRRHSGPRTTRSPSPA